MLIANSVIPGYYTFLHDKSLYFNRRGALRKMVINKVSLKVIMVCCLRFNNAPA